MHQIANICRNAELAKSFLDAVKEKGKQTLLDGDDLPGFKLVAGRSTRKWDQSEDEMAEVFRAARLMSKVSTQKLMTGPAMEKAFKTHKRIQAILAEHLIKPEGAPTMVPEDDKRKSIQPTTEGLEILGESTIEGLDILGE